MTDRTPDQYSRAGDAGSRRVRIARRAHRASSSLHGLVTGAWAFWTRNFQAIVSVLLVVLAVGFGLVGIVVAVDQSATKRAARSSCERSVRLGPKNALEHEKLGIYTADDLRYFRETIPKASSCP